MNAKHPNEIVVGFDGSSASHAALRWAVRRAAEEQASVTVVEVGYRVRLAPGTSYAVQPYGTAPPIERMGQRSQLHDAVAAAKGNRTEPGIVELHVDGEPAVELTKLAENATMLVVGHTRRGRLSELILGSTAASCLRHARCPVVLVPEEAVF
jgi:nucleotide-binding universal stress UspA family protein